MLPYQIISRGNDLAIVMMPNIRNCLICINDYINNSHKDHFEKRHNNKNESSRILWKYGVISDDGIPFVIVQCQ